MAGRGGAGSCGPRGGVGVRKRAWRVPIAPPVVLLLAVACALVPATVATAAEPQETYEGAVGAAGPAAVFPFGDPVGSSTIEDSLAPHTYTAVNDGIALGGEGLFAGAKSGSFGGEAYATLPSDPLAGASEFTAEAWVYWNGGSPYNDPVFAFGSSASNYMYLTPGSNLKEHPMLFEIHTAGGASAIVMAPKATRLRWEYLVVTETSLGTLTLYRDGRPVGEPVQATVSPASLGSAPTVYLGKSPISGEPDFKGSLGDVAFYATALPAEQIQEHYDAAEFPFNTSLPTISGVTREGDVLTAKAGSWGGVTPMTADYQWQRCNAEGQCPSIPGATSSQYVIQPEDVGSTLRVLVKEENEAGAGEASLRAYRNDCGDRAEKHRKTRGLRRCRGRSGAGSEHRRLGWIAGSEIHLRVGKLRQKNMWTGGGRKH